MNKCERCAHMESCKAWVRHCEALYADFEYSVKDCPYYTPRCKYCESWTDAKRETFAGEPANVGFCDQCQIYTDAYFYCVWGTEPYRDDNCDNTEVAE